MLPFSYNSDRCYLYPINPRSIYGYWDFSAKTWEELERSGGKLVVILRRADEEVARIDVDRESKNYYFKHVEPNASYRMTLAYRDGGRLQAIMASRSVTTPTDRLSGDRSLRFRKFRFLKRRIDLKELRKGVIKAPVYIPYETLSPSMPSDASAGTAAIEGRGAASAAGTGEVRTSDLIGHRANVSSGVLGSTAPYSEKKRKDEREKGSRNE